MPTILNQGSGYTTWDAQNNYVERLMDNAGFSAAHPDDTLVLVGPPRYSGSQISDLVPVGMLQNFGINQSRPFQPMMAIGSGRQFFLGGKSQGSASIGRLFVNAKSLMRKLYSNYALSDGKDLETSFDEQPGKGDFFINLDSELFLIPFGMGIVFADKSKHVIGSLYLELCVIPSYSIGLAAGQAAILESVNVLFDRIVPMDVAQLGNKFEEWNKIMASGMAATAATSYVDQTKVGTQVTTP